MDSGARRLLRPSVVWPTLAALGGAFGSGLVGASASVPWWGWLSGLGTVGLLGLAFEIHLRQKARRVFVGRLSVELQKAIALAFVHLEKTKKAYMEGTQGEVESVMWHARYRLDLSPPTLPAIDSEVEEAFPGLSVALWTVASAVDALTLDSRKFEEAMNPDGDFIVIAVHHLNQVTEACNRVREKVGLPLGTLPPELRPPEK